MTDIIFGRETYVLNVLDKYHHLWSDHPVHYPIKWNTSLLHSEFAKVTGGSTLSDQIEYLYSYNIWFNWILRFTSFIAHPSSSFRFNDHIPFTMSECGNKWIHATRLQSKWIGNSDQMSISWTARKKLWGHIEQCYCLKGHCRICVHTPEIGNVVWKSIISIPGLRYNLYHESWGACTRLLAVHK